MSIRQCYECSDCLEATATSKSRKITRIDATYVAILVVPLNLTISMFVRLNLNTRKWPCSIHFSKVDSDL